MKIFLVDDSIMVVARLTTLLSGIETVQIVGHAVNEDDAFKEIQAKQPDIAILDISLESGNGISLLRRIKQAGLAVKIIMLTNEVASTYKSISITSGAIAFFDKSMDLESLVEKIKSMC